MTTSLDLETRSAVDLKKAGAYRYFDDPTADILCAAFAVEDGPVLTWRNGEACPDDLAHAIRTGERIAAWNATFEYWAMLLVLGPRYGWPVPRPEQMVDTMAQAAAMSIPQALDGAARAMGLDEQKDKDGTRLIRKFSLPRKARKGEVPGRLYWTEPGDDPADFERFVSYCAQDVEVERALRKLLVPLSDAEQAVWVFNLVMNTRGVRIDLDLVRALQRIAEQAKERLDREMAVATGFEITACSQVAALTRWLQAQGVPADKLNKNAIEELLAEELPPAARRAVEIRKEAAKTSTAKLTSMLKCASADGRVRGLHQYHGAGTGRWAGRLVQTQNMPRGTGTIKDPEGAVDTMLHGDAGWVDLIYGNPMSAVSDMLRSCLVASPGHRLLAADFSSIEGRVTAWVAGEDWKLDAFRLNDTLLLDVNGKPIPDPNEKGDFLRVGPGMYELTAAGIFNAPVAEILKKDPRRQVGKASELALGFGGGVLAYHSMAKIYRVDMAPVYPILKETADAEVIERAIERYEECAERQDTGTDLMTREAWIASEITKVQWRARHPSTVALWAGLEDAARQAVQTPGSISSYGPVSYIVRRGFLWCRLPSSRCLAYGAPRVEDRKTPWGATKPSVTALGVNSQTKKWERFALYGGLATENVVQAIARDLMAHGMLMAEAAGYPIVMTVHDEAVADTPAGHGTLAEFERLLCDSPPWATGLPVVASGYESLRYKKD